MVILGIDPGLNATGYGIVEATAHRLRALIAGDIRPARTLPLAERLGVIHAALATLIARHQPDTVVLEQIFTHHAHVTTAALMAHARGVACLVAQEHGLSVAECPSTEVKRSLTGNGHASKDQVARMVGQWLQQRDAAWSVDATDALALAIVHARHSLQRRRLPAAVVG
jgi:crossover junction endodeoxyribonuclease RuvC